MLTKQTSVGRDWADLTPLGYPGYWVDTRARVWQVEKRGRAGAGGGERHYRQLASRPEANSWSVSLLAASGRRRRASNYDLLWLAHRGSLPDDKFVTCYRLLPPGQVKLENLRLADLPQQDYGNGQRDQRICELRSKKWTLQEIGSFLRPKITKERVRQILRRMGKS